MLLAGCVLSGRWITSKRMCYDGGWSQGFGAAPSLGWLLACVCANHLILLIVADHQPWFIRAFIDKFPLTGLPWIPPCLGLKCLGPLPTLKAPVPKLMYRIYSCISRPPRSRSKIKFLIILGKRNQFHTNRNFPKPQSFLPENLLKTR